MGDLGDYWRDVKEHRQKVKAKRQAAMPNPNKLLNELGASFEVKNYGEHYIVEYGDIIVDYWPSTGYWKVRKLGHTGYNIRPLVKYLKKNAKEECFE